MKRRWIVKSFIHSILLALILMPLALRQSGIGRAEQPPPQPQDTPVAQTEVSQNVRFIPLVSKEYPLPPKVFGVETYTLDAWKLDSAKTAQSYWLRQATFSWASIEPVRTTPTPTYHWEYVNETGIQALAEKNINLIATIKFVPSWAQKYPGYSCGPAAEQALDEFAQFVAALVERYSVPPYNIKYWEIGNEPDVDHTVIPPDEVFGCWGDKDDYYYGGGYYAQMLKSIYPAVKNVNPYAQVMIGGLLMNCDPTHPPSGSECREGRFMEGILRNQGGAYFDILSYHAYAYYNPGKIYEATPAWAPRGGVFYGKLSYLREIMAQYGVSKPLLLTEAPLACHPFTPGCNPVGDDFLDKQADYVTWVYVRSWAENLMGTIWYTLEDSGWYSTGLYSAGAARPAYYAFKFSASELNDAKLVRAITQYPGLTGYEFRDSTKLIWVFWSPDYLARSITLPADVIRVLDKFGDQISPVNGAIAVTAPVYIELSP